jgi:hypothetical protein
MERWCGDTAETCHQVEIRIDRRLSFVHQMMKFKIKKNVSESEEGI